MISVCILIKNEEDVLDECLKSIYEISDEIIIIDNGSTDNSIKIAKNYNCKIFYDYGQSFDEIRNKFFKLASHEWILSLDADERLQVKNINIKEELSYISNECKGIFIPRLDYIGKGKWAQNKFLRLYRNSSLLKYSNVKIHSSLKPSINRVNGSIKNLDGIFIHHFDNIYKKKNYKKRTFYKEELLIQINNQNISNTEKYSYLCFLGLEYVYEKKFNKAFYYFEAAIKCSLPKKTTAHILKAQLTLSLGNYEEALTITRYITLNILKHSIQSKNIEVIALYSLKKYDLCKSIIYNLIEEYPNYSYLYLNLSYILFLENNEVYLKYLLIAKKMNPYISLKKIYRDNINSIFNIQSVCLPFSNTFLVKMKNI